MLLNILIGLITIALIAAIWWAVGNWWHQKARCNYYNCVCWAWPVVLIFWGGAAALVLWTIGSLAFVLGQSIREFLGF